MQLLLSLATPRVAVKRKQEHLEGGDIDMEALGLAPLKRSRTSVVLDEQPNGTPSKPKVGDESVTEDESDGEPSVARKNGTGMQEPTPARSASPELARTQSRIVGDEYPLRDFRKNIKKRGDIVSTLADELGDVVLEILMQNFASRRHAEMMDCLKEYREMALKVRS